MLVFTRDILGFADITRCGWVVFKKRSKYPTTYAIELRGSTLCLVWSTHNGRLHRRKVGRRPVRLQDIVYKFVPAGSQVRVIVDADPSIVVRRLDYDAR